MLSKIGWFMQRLFFGLVIAGTIIMLKQNSIREFWWFYILYMACAIIEYWCFDKKEKTQ